MQLCIGYYLASGAQWDYGLPADTGLPVDTAVVFVMAGAVFGLLHSHLTVRYVRSSRRALVSMREELSQGPPYGAPFEQHTQPDGDITVNVATVDAADYVAVFLGSAAAAYYAWSGLGAGWTSWYAEPSWELLALPALWLAGALLRNRIAAAAIGGGPGVRGILLIGVPVMLAMSVPVLFFLVADGAVRVAVIGVQSWLSARD